MTVLEAIQANPVFSQLETNTIQYALDSRSIDGTAVYSSSSLKDVELVSADLYYDISLQPEFSEGQLSVKYDAKELKRRALALYNKHDDEKASQLGFQKIDLSVNPIVE